MKYNPYRKHKVAGKIQAIRRRLGRINASELPLGAEEHLKKAAIELGKVMELFKEETDAKVQ